MDYNDRELLDLIKEKNEEAEDLIFKKYHPYIEIKARKIMRYLDNIGIDENDLIQEGRIGLSMAINNYDENIEATFYTYAVTLIDRRMYSLVRSSRRLKHKILNESISFEQTTEEGNSYSLENLISDPLSNPEEVFLLSELEEELFNYLKLNLTTFEYQVFSLKYNSFSNKEISNILEKDMKSVDNAFQRIKAKISKYLKEIKKEEKN